MDKLFEESPDLEEDALESVTDGKEECDGSESHADAEEPESDGAGATPQSKKARTFVSAGFAGSENIASHEMKVCVKCKATSKDTSAPSLHSTFLTSFAVGEGPCHVGIIL